MKAEKNLTRCPSCGAHVIAGHKPTGAVIVLDVEAPIFWAVRPASHLPGQGILVKDGGGPAYLDHYRICVGNNEGRKVELHDWIKDATERRREIEKEELRKLFTAGEGEGLEDAGQ